MIVNYADGVINLPRSVANNIKSATREDLAALIALLSEPRALFSSAPLDECMADIAVAAGITPAELDSALSFWRGAGVIGLEGKASSPHQAAGVEPQPEKPPQTETAEDEQKKPLPKRGLPELTGAEAEAMIEASPERRSLLNECQQALGRIFDNNESATVLSMREYLGLEDEYILLLIAYCAKNGKKNIKYIEKMALSLYERDVDTPEALVDYLSWLDASKSTEGKLRALLGMGSRSFSKKERECFERWSRVFHYDFDMMEAAYNATVNAIGKPSMPYMNKILESWHELGFKTPEEAAGREHPHTDTKDSFDTDDFFRLAVMRGVEDAKNKKKDEG